MKQRAVVDLSGQISLFCPARVGFVKRAWCLKVLSFAHGILIVRRSALIKDDHEKGLSIGASARGCCSSTAFVEHQKIVLMCSHSALRRERQAGQQAMETGESFWQAGQQAMVPIWVEPLCLCSQRLLEYSGNETLPPNFFPLSEENLKTSGRIMPLLHYKKTSVQGPQTMSQTGERGWGGDRDGDDCMSCLRDRIQDPSRSQAHGGNLFSPWLKGKRTNGPKSY